MCAVQRGNQNHFRAHNTRQMFEQTRYPEQYNEEQEVGSTTPRLNHRTNNASTASFVSSVASSPPRCENSPGQSERRSRSQIPYACRSNSVSRSRSRSSDGSRSSSSSSELRSSSSDSSDRSWSPSKSRSPLSSNGNQSNAKCLDKDASAVANPSTMTSCLPSSISTSSVNCTPSLVNSQNNASTHSNSASTVNGSVAENYERKPHGICIRNLPIRSTDTSLKDGLFHKYKRHGKVTMVKVIGQGAERYAVVCFKKSEDVEKAVEVSKDKQFFGCKIEVTAYKGSGVDDNESRPLESELDEYHPKATRTLFIGNLEKDIAAAELRKHFEQFGEIIEIDIKKQSSSTSYSFIQYSDIASVVKAMRKLDGENLGANRIKLGFGKSMPTNCVWLGGIVDTVTEEYLARHFSQYGLVVYCAVNWGKGHALIFYDSVEFAEIAVGDMRGRIIGGKKLQVDFASRECQSAFFDKLKMTGQMVPIDRPWERCERRSAEFDIVGADDQYGRYSEQYNEEREVGSTTPRLNHRTDNASTASVVSSVASSPPIRSESRPKRSKRQSRPQKPSASQSNSMSRSVSQSSSGSRSSSSSSRSRSPLSSDGNQNNAKWLDRAASAVANPSTMTTYLPSSISTSSVNCTPSLVNSQNNASTHSNSASTVNDSVVENVVKKPLCICVQNLPVRSSDASLKDGLFHEYKKHCKVTMVKVIGQGTERYAVVCFKKPEDVEKALEVSKDKLFFGCKIEVTAHEGLDADDNEFKPLEAELDEYHKKATRTLFIGNLERYITAAELRKHFEQFGEIIEIDIKKQNSSTSYAFIQYSDIASVVKAMRKLDGENLGANRIRLGFGKRIPTNCVWLNGIVDTITVEHLERHFSPYGLVARCAVDWEKGHALIFYDSVEFARIAVREMRGHILDGKKLQVDFASRKCQTAFFDKLKMTSKNGSR